MSRISCHGISAMSRNNFFGHMRRSLADNLEVAHNCINGLWCPT